jgi:hypothetical protein
MVPRPDDCLVNHHRPAPSQHARSQAPYRCSIFQLLSVDPAGPIKNCLKPLVETPRTPKCVSPFLSPKSWLKIILKVIFPRCPTDHVCSRSVPFLQTYNWQQVDINSAYIASREDINSRQIMRCSVPRDGYLFHLAQKDTLLANGAELLQTIPGPRKCFSRRERGSYRAI